mgnify:CR=1 FL=1
MKVNFGNVAQNYAKFRNDLPVELLESLNVRGIHFKAKKIADLGCGTGILCRALYHEGAEVVGIEPAIQLIEEAKIIDQAEDAHIEYYNQFSESTSLPENTYDIVTVLRAWHWFDSEKTLTEIKRILKEKGTLIIIDSGFISKGEVVMDTLNFIKQRMPEQTLKSAGTKSTSKQLINSFPIEWFKEWQDNQFDLQDTYKLHYDVQFTNEEWCGRVGSLSWLASFEEQERNLILEELHNYLDEKYQANMHTIEHRCYVAILNRI